MPGPVRIDQVVPSFAGRDAIGIHTLHLRDLLRDMGFRSDIYCGGALPDVRHEAHLMDRIGEHSPEGRWLLFHHSSGSPVAEEFLARPEVKLLDYHNITPAALVDVWAPWVRDELELGRRQLVELVSACGHAFADSPYNARELLAAGCTRAEVPGLLFDLEAFEAEVDQPRLDALVRARATGGSDWVFVGKVAPHKAQHHLVRAFACYTQLFDPDARLHLVGTWMGEEYPRALERYAERLGLGHAVRLVGLVTEGELAAYYRAADVLVCASDHEGFCVPLVEAMHLGVPVVAYGSSAIPETVGSGGLVLADKSPISLATVAHRVITDLALRERLIAAGKRRAQGYSLDRARDRWRTAISDAVASGPRAAAVPSPGPVETMRVTPGPPR